MSKISCSMKTIPKLPIFSNFDIIIKVKYTIIKGGSVYRLKCKNCESVSVQITENSEPDYTCLECGGRCVIFKEFLADKEDVIFSMIGIRD